MAKYWGFIGNEKYDVGLTGQTVFVLDKNGNELAKFKDLKYAYYAAISPNCDILAVKSNEGRMAFYSLENMTLIKKFRFAKTSECADGNFCFSTDGKELYSIEGNINPCNTSVSVYDMAELTRTKRFFYDEEYLSIECVEYGKETDEIYLMGYLRDKENGVASEYFVGKLKNGELCEVVPISQKTHMFYDMYKNLEGSGFTEKAYKWSYIDMSLEDLKKSGFSLEKLWESHFESI